MEVILKDDIKGLGFKQDVVKVKPGYGRNYLIPKGIAIIANAQNRKMRDEEVRQAAFKQEQIKNKAQDIANGVEKLTLKLKAKVGESGRIFGAITTLQVSDALKQKGYDVDRKKISFPVQIKEVGDYTAEMDLHREVKANVKITVVPEK